MTSKRLALVTGGAAGIGHAIVHRLASDGCDVAFCDLPTRVDELGALCDNLMAKYATQRFAYFCCDVAEEEQVYAMFEGVVQELGGLDIMVANAGVASFGAVVDVSLTEFNRVFDVNFKGVFLCFQQAAKQMIKQGRGGRIIGASSIFGKQGVPMAGIYCATKFAVRGLTQSLASELGPHGITVNSYAPGVVVTDATRVMSTTLGLDHEKWLAEEAKKSPLLRNASPDDIANLVSFLASADSSYMTGQTVIVDGGRVFD